MEAEKLYDEIASNILNIDLERPVIIGINGIDAVGKSCFAEGLIEKLKPLTKRSVVQSSVDNFTVYRGIEEGLQPHLQPDADKWYYEEAFPPHLVKSNFLIPLQKPDAAGRFSCNKAIFNWSTDSSAEGQWEVVKHDAIVVFDGVFIFRQELSDYFDYKVFLDGDMDIILERGLERAAERGQDVEEMRRGFNNCYYKAQKYYYQKERPWEKADIWIDNTDFENPVLKNKPLSPISLEPK